MRPFLAFSLCLSLLNIVRASDEPGVLPSTTDGVEKPAGQEAPEKGSDSDLIVRGIFNSELPGVGRKYQLKVIVHPHIGDLSRYSYLRTAWGFRYNLSSRFELRAETNTFFGTGLRDVGFFEEYGLLDVRLGGKYQFGETLWRGWDTGAGISYRFPLSSAPRRLTDGFNHLESFVTFARPLPRHPDLRVFWRLGVDLVSDAGVVGRLEQNELTDDANSIGAGFVWKRGLLTYTFETSYETTRLLGKTSDDVFTIRPGFQWELPRRYSPGSGGQWVFGVALTLSEGPDGFDVGLGGKLRLGFDPKKLLRRSGKKVKP